MPNVLDAWDEFALDDNYVGFEEKLTQYEGWVQKGDLEAVKVLDVVIPDAAITNLFDVPVPEVHGEVSS